MGVFMRKQISQTKLSQFSVAIFINLINDRRGEVFRESLSSASRITG